MKRKITSLILTAIMGVSLASMPVFADDAEPVIAGDADEEEQFDEVEKTEEPTEDPAEELEPISVRPSENRIGDEESEQGIEENDDIQLLASEGDVEINEANFPDAIFREYVEENFDTNGDGVLSESEIESVTEISIYDSDVTTLSGIEFFANLNWLDCEDLNLTNLDVSNNLELVYLACGGNNLDALDVSDNTNLEWLYCNGNNLSDLDVSHNDNLRVLECAVNNLTELDVSHNEKLTDFNFAENDLSNIDLSQNSAMEHIDCDNNNLNELDVGNNSELWYLSCPGNNISKLDFSNNPELECLVCTDNDLYELDISNNPSIDQLFCENNHLVKLDLSTMIDDSDEFDPSDLVGVSGQTRDVTAEMTEDILRISLSDLVGEENVANISLSDQDNVSIIGDDIMIEDTSISQVTYDYATGTTISTGASMDVTLTITDIFQDEIVDVGTQSEGVTANADYDWNDLMTTEELEEYLEDAVAIDIDCIIKGGDIADIPAEDEELVENKAKELWGEGNYTAFYMDAYISMVVEHSDGTEEEVLFTETLSPIDITVTIPDELLEADGDTYKIIRVHDSSVDVLDANDNGDGTVTFSSDKFSTYALIKTYASEDESEPVDKTALQEEYDEDKDLTESDYTEESWNAFKTALDNAEAVLNDDDATQDQVDAALDALTTAKDALAKAEGKSEPEDVNKEDLQKEYDEDKDLTESDYTEESWNAFKTALDNAEAVLNDDDATQAQVDAALEALKTAKEALVETGTKTEPDNTREISGSKTWDDDDDKADARPDSITVKLYQNDKLYISEAVTADDGWSWSWTVPENDENGNAYVYTIKEEDVKYYIVSYEKNGSFNITNTFVGEEGAVTGSGSGNGGDNPKTGDNNNIALWLVLMLVGVAGVFGVYRVKKRS